MHRNIEADREAGFLSGGANDAEASLTPDEARSARARKRWHHAFWLVTRSMRISRAFYGIMGKTETSKAHSVVGRIARLEQRPTSDGTSPLGASSEEVSRAAAKTADRLADMEGRWVAGGGRGEAAAGKGKSGGELRRGMNGDAAAAATCVKW